MIELTDAELAYLAGILDVRGVMGVREHLGVLRPQLDIRDVDERLPALFAKTFGGGPRSYHGSGKDRWYWRLTGLPAQRAVAALRPFLRLRTESAELILAWRPQPRARRRVAAAEAMTRRKPLAAGVRL